MIISPDEIAHCALSHYDNVLPRGKGKPQLNREWTVYAAIVAVFHQKTKNAPADKQTEPHFNNAHYKDYRDMWVVSCATGSKCCAVLHPNDKESNKNQKDNKSCKNLKWGGGVLHDSHAEVLAKRGFMRVLWVEIEQTLALLVNRDVNVSTKVSTVAANGNKDNEEGFEKSLDRENSRFLLELQKLDGANNNEKAKIHFQIREGLTFHMYISDAPCGDAAIYDIDPVFNTNSINSGADKLQKDVRSTNKQNQQRCTNTSHVSTSSPEKSSSNKKSNKMQENRSRNFTGAKLVVSNNTDKSQVSSFLQYCEQNSTKYIDVTKNSEEGKPNSTISDNAHKFIARERTQILSALRTKSGRSNIPTHLRSTSMSCSDKLCRWSVLGLQGGLLLRWIPSPIILSSICVSRDLRSTFVNEKKWNEKKGNENVDGQWQALQRAIPNRIRSSLKTLMQHQQRKRNLDIDHGCINLNKKMYFEVLTKSIPSVHIVDRVFEQGMAYTQYRNIKKSLDSDAFESQKHKMTSKRSIHHDQKDDEKKRENILSNRPLPQNSPNEEDRLNVKKQKKKHEKNCWKNKEQKEKVKILFSSKINSGDNNCCVLQRCSPCGISLNWQNQKNYKDLTKTDMQESNQNYIPQEKSAHLIKRGSLKNVGNAEGAPNTLELTIGATGLKQKQKKRKSMFDQQLQNSDEILRQQQQQVVFNRFSRLSRYSFFKTALDCKKVCEKIVRQCRECEGKSINYSDNTHKRINGIEINNGLFECSNPSEFCYQEFKTQGMQEYYVEIMHALFQGSGQECGSFTPTSNEFKNDSCVRGPLEGWITSREAGDFQYYT